MRVTIFRSCSGVRLDGLLQVIHRRFFMSSRLMSSCLWRMCFLADSSNANWFAVTLCRVIVGSVVSWVVEEHTFVQVCLLFVATCGDSFAGSFRKSVMMKRDFGTVCPSSLTCVRLSVCSAALSCNVQRAAPQQAGADCRNTLVFLE